MRYLKSIKSYWLLVFMLGFVGCDTDATNSVFNEDNLKSEPDPSVTSISSVENPPFAGIDVLTIKGTNFSTELTRNYVYFTFYLPVYEGDNLKLDASGKPARGKVRDTVRGTVLSATPTELTVRTPARPTFDAADRSTIPLLNVDVRVSVLGAENFAKAVALDLAPSFEVFGKTTFDQKLEEPFGLASDKSGNVYVSLFSSGQSAGIFRITPAGDRTPFVTAAGTQNNKLDDLAYRDDESYLYAVRGLRAIFRFKQNGTQETFVAVPTTLESAKLVSIAFDAKNNVWTGGNNLNIYRVLPDKTTKAFAFAADVRALRVKDGSLYILAKKDGAFSLFKAPIQANNDLGTIAKIADLGLTGSDEAFAFALASDGTMYVGTNRMSNPILAIIGEGASAKVSTLYEGIFSGLMRSFVWGNKPYLYVAQGLLPTGTGSGIPANFFRINTRRTPASL